MSRDFKELSDMSDDILKSEINKICEEFRAGAETGIDVGLAFQVARTRGLELGDATDLETVAKSQSTMHARLSALPGVISLSDGYVGLSLEGDGALLASSRSAKCAERVRGSLESVGVPSEISAPAGDQIPVYDLALIKSDQWASSPDGADTGVSDSEPEVSATMLAKSEPEWQVIYYLVSEPDTVDAHGDQIDSDTVRGALHAYMRGEREIRIEHGAQVVTGRATVVEGFIAPCDMGSFHGRLLDTPILEGSSIVGIHYPDRSLWEQYRDVDHGISWGGMARRVAG